MFQDVAVGVPLEGHPVAQAVLEAGLEPALVERKRRAVPVRVDEVQRPPVLIDVGLPVSQRVDLPRRVSSRGDIGPDAPQRIGVAGRQGVPGGLVGVTAHVPGHAPRQHAAGVVERVGRLDRLRVFDERQPVAGIVAVFRETAGGALDFGQVAGGAVSERVPTVAPVLDGLDPVLGIIA